MQNEMIEDRVRYLKEIVAAKEKGVQKAPAGYLRITTSHGKVQYYCMTKQNGVAQQLYLPKAKEKEQKLLAQKSYDRLVLRAAEQELYAWEELAKHFPEKTVEEVYEALSPARRKLVTPIRQSDEEFRAKWEAVSYEPGYFRPDTPVYMTDRGERVRSKSEQLIANLLYRLGVPYRYEYPVELNVEGRRKTWRPDFLILDVKKRKEYCLEHFGMLDDVSESNNYARSAFWKMKVYEENGRYEGKNMIYSFETGKAPLDIAYLEKKICRILEL